MVIFENTAVMRMSDEQMHRSTENTEDNGFLYVNPCSISVKYAITPPICLQQLHKKISAGIYGILDHPAESSYNETGLKSG